MSSLPAYSERVPDIRMAGVEYRQVRLNPPFSVRVPLGDDWRLYLIRGGEGEFKADDAAGTQCRLPPGSVVSLSGVLQHRFSSVSEAGARRPEVPWEVEGLSADPRGCVSIIMGRIAKSRMAFLAPFERIVVLPSDQYPELVGRIARALNWAAEELQQADTVSEVIVQRLAEITTLEIGRFVQSTGNMRERSARRAALDQRILRAISAFYASPQDHWSVDRLAEIAGMSRTAFAVRYRELIGTTPVKSLRQLRMQLAADQLSRPAASVEMTAKKVGYRSDSAFIRVYSKEFGTTPGQANKANLR